MILYAFLLLIAIGVLVAFGNWRRGIFFFILLGAIQDPVRKLIPGAPSYLVLATVPVLFATFFQAFASNPYFRREFRQYHPRPAAAIAAFVISLLPAAVVSATYGPGSWQLTLIGMLSYSTAILSFYLGFIYARNADDIRRLAVFFCLVTAVMLIGTPLEYLGLAKEWTAIGGKALGFKWLRYKPGYIIEMVAGFYRSPDIMGWHAVIMAMLAGILALLGKGRRRYFWIAVACWGIAAAMLCGRRKMVLMLPVYMLTVSLIYWQLRMPFRKLLAAVAIVLVGTYFIYQQIGSSTELENYYTQEQGDIIERFEAHNLGDMIGTYQQNGFWGAGLGTASQGTQHLQVARPRTWQEGGLSRILVELGVPGLLCFLFLCLSFLAAIWRLVCSQLDISVPGLPLSLGLIGIVAANGVSFIYSHQIFGDPFVMGFFCFLLGITFSGERVGIVVRVGAQRPAWLSRYGPPPFARQFAAPQAENSLEAVPCAEVHSVASVADRPPFT